MVCATGIDVVSFYDFSIRIWKVFRQYFIFPLILLIISVSSTLRHETTAT